MRKPSPDLETIKAGLATTALVPERVNALLGAGLKPRDIAYVTGSNPSTVRNWKTGENKPPLGLLADERLDDLRAAMGQLLSGGIAPEPATMWLKSRDGEQAERPIDTIRNGGILEVFDAARVLIEQHVQSRP